MYDVDTPFNVKFKSSNAYVERASIIVKICAIEIISTDIDTCKQYEQSIKNRTLIVLQYVPRIYAYGFKTVCKKNKRDVGITKTEWTLRLKS